MAYLSEQVESVEEKLNSEVAKANLITLARLSSRSYVQHVLSF